MRRHSYSRKFCLTRTPYPTRLFWGISSVFFCGLMVSKWLLTPNEIILVNSDEIFNERLANSLQPVILMWTNVWTEDAEQMQTDKIMCEDTRMQCKYTSDRRAMTEASAVLFHARDVYLLDLPTQKYRNQPWILWNHEAPANTPLDVYRSVGDAFDKHLSYRSTWDLFSPYGLFLNRTNGQALDELDTKALRERFHRQVGAAWLVSDCQTESNREAYVEELKTFFPVSIYGKCGQHECPMGSNDSCMTDFSDKFMFYLAFENSLCPEYVTEKLYRTLQYPIIPVVLSGHRSEFLNSLHAFVDGSNLSPIRLASKLLFISRNFSEYSKYFAWKRNFTVHSQLHPLCLLCDAVRGEFKSATRRQERISRLISEDHASCTRWNSQEKKFVPVSRA